jgi:tetratricopeptide (TPR) repeat protein
MAAYQEALRIDDASAPARYYLAEVLVRTGEIVRASSQLHLVVKQAPDYGPAYVLRGDIGLHQGDHRQAAAEYCRGIELDAADAPIYERLATAFEAIGDPSQAVKALDGAIALEPGRWACYATAGRLCEGAGWFNRARRYWEALVYVAGFKEEARAGLQRVTEHLQRTGLEGIDPPGAPPEQAELKGFKPPATLEKSTGPAARPGARFAGPPPPLDDFMTTPRHTTTAQGTAKDGFGTSASAAGYLADFREPVQAPPELAPPATEAAPEAPADPVLSKLEAFQAKLRGLLE